MTSPALTRICLRVSVAVLAVIAAVTASAYTAVNAPASAAPASSVSYSAKTVGKSVQFDVRNGSVAVENGALIVKNTAGRAVLSYPLAYTLDDRTFPIKAATSGHTATLTPVRDVAQSVKIDSAKAQSLRHSVACAKIRGPQTRQERDDQALNRFTSQMAASVSIGTLIGTAIGAFAGFLVGLPIVVVGAIPILDHRRGDRRHGRDHRGRCAHRRVLESVHAHDQLAVQAALLLRRSSR